MGDAVGDPDLTHGESITPGDDVDTLDDVDNVEDVDDLDNLRDVDDQSPSRALKAYIALVLIQYAFSFHLELGSNLARYRV